MAITAIERHDIAELIVIMFNAAPGAHYLSQTISAYESVGKSLPDLADLIGEHPNYQAVPENSNTLTNEEFTENLLSNVGLSGDFRATTEIVNALNDGATKAEVSYGLFAFLNDVLVSPSGMWAPQYVTAANIMDNKADVSIYYSVTKGLSAFTLEELQGVLEGVDETQQSVDDAIERINVENDPQTFNLTINAPSVTEDDAGTKILTFTLTLLDQEGDATVGTTVLNYSTADGTASAGDDYQAAAGQVTFAVGQTQATVSIVVLGDTVFEGNETVLLNVTGATLAAPQTGTGTIVNNDPPPQTFVASIAAASVVEGDAGTTILSFVITLDQSPTAAVSFTYATGGGTATAGDDYTATSGTVNFAIGQTSATVSVVVNGDVTPELAETLMLTLTGSQLASVAVGTGTILNDDTEFDLTPDLDLLTTSPFDDTINGTETTFTLGDEIDGGDGDDLLRLVFDGDIEDPDVILAPFIEVTDVERVEILSDLSVGEDGGDTFDMSDWIGVETILIRTAGSAADVNIMSNASESITVLGADLVEISDNTVAEIDVDAGGEADITAMGASSINVTAGEDVYIDASDADITVEDADTVDIDSNNGDILVGVGGANDVDGSVDIESSDADVMTVDADGSVEIDANDITTLTVTSSDDIDVDLNNVSSATLSASDELHIGVQGADSIVASGGDGIDVTLANFFDWDLNPAPGRSDAHLNISDDMVEISAGAAGFIGIDDAEDVEIDVGAIGAVSLTRVDTFGGEDDVRINQDSDSALDLSLTDSHIDLLSIIGETDDAVPDTVNLTVNNVSDSDSAVTLTSDSTVTTIVLTGAGNLDLDIENVAGVLTTISGADFTGDLELDASESIDVTSGSGDDDIDIDGSDVYDVTVNAGEGNNTVDVNADGVVVVTVGAGNDDVTVNFDALIVAGSSVALGTGTNTLTLRSFDPITDVDLDAFDVGTMPLTGTLNALIFNAEVDLGSDSSSTLDVSGLDGPVSFIGFDDVDVLGPEASLTIVGTGPVLELQSSDDFGGGDFGPGGTIILETVGVTDLQITVSEDTAVELMGDGLVNLHIDAGGEIELMLNGDSTSDDVIDQLESLVSVILDASDDVDVELENIRTGATLTINAGVGGGDGNVYLDISDAEVGNVSVNMGSDSNEASIEVNNTSDSTVTVGNITVNDNADVVFCDDDGGSTIDIEISDNDGSIVVIGNVEATADSEVDMQVSNNNHASVTVENIDLESRSDAASLLVANNIDNEAGADATVDLGTVSVVGEDGASVDINGNSDSAITVSTVTVTSQFGTAFVNIEDNSEATVDMGAVVITNSGGVAFMEISDNDVAEVDVGNVTIGGAGGAESYFEITWNNGSDVGVGNVIVSSGYGAHFGIHDNSDGTDILVGDVNVNSTDGYVNFNISDNVGIELDVGAVMLTTGDSDSVGDSIEVNILMARNSDSAITIEGFTIDADGDVDFGVSGSDNDSGSILIDGNINVTAGEAATFSLDHVDLAGDVSVTAGEDVDFDLWSVSDSADEMDTITVTAGEDVDVFVSDVDSVSAITVNAGIGGGSDAIVVVSEVDDLGSLTVTAGGTATVEINGVNSDSEVVFTLDIDGVMGLATVDASDADFDSSGLYANIMIGDGDVMYSNDLIVNGAALNDESREKFFFGSGTGSDDVGAVVIDNFRPGATGAVDGVWTDRLNFSMLDGVDSTNDVTFTNDGTDVIIDFVNPAYGSITLSGVGLLVNATDLVVASMEF
jgi:hypothetical protein